MKGAREEGTHLEIVSGGAEEKPSYFPEMPGPPRLTGPSISRYWLNCLLELGLRTRIRNKAAHTGIHVRWEPSSLSETHPSGGTGRGALTACPCKKEFPSTRLKFGDAIKCSQ